MYVNLNLVEVLLERVRLEAAVLNARLRPRDPELNLFNINLEGKKKSKIPVKHIHMKKGTEKEIDL